MAGTEKEHNVSTNNPKSVAVETNDLTEKVAQSISFNRGIWYTQRDVDEDDNSFLGGREEEEGLSDRKKTVVVKESLGAKSFKNLDPVKHFLSDIDYSYTKNAFVIDKGHIRSVERVKNIIHSTIDMMNEFGDKSFISKTLQKFSSEDFLSELKDNDLVSVGENIDPVKDKIFMPIKVDVGNKIGKWYPVIINEDANSLKKVIDGNKGYHDTAALKMLRNLLKRHTNANKGLFEASKIKFSNVDLNSSKKLLDDSVIKESRAKKIGKSVLNYFTGNSFFSSKRKKAKEFNKKYGIDEDGKEIGDTDKKDNDDTLVAGNIQDENGTKGIESNNNEDFKSEIIARARKFIEKDLGMSIKGELSMPFRKLTSEGLLADIRLKVKFYEKGPLTTLTSTFKIGFGKKITLYHIGSELINVPDFDINLLEGEFILNASVDTLLCDAGEGDLVWIAKNPSFRFKIGENETTASAENLTFKSGPKPLWSGERIKGILNINLLNNNFKGQIQDFDFEDNKPTRGFGIGKLDKLSLNSRFKAENIAGTWMLLKGKNHTLVLDAEVGLKDLKTSGIVVESMSGRLISDFEKEEDEWKFNATDLSGGNLKATFLGQTVNLTGVNYSSKKPHDITADTFYWEGQVLGYNGNLEVLKPNITENEGFHFEKITGVIYDIGYGDYVTAKFVEVGVEKEGNKYKINGAANIKATLKTIPGIENVTLSGLFSVSGYDDRTEIKYSLTDGMLDASFMGNIINLKGVKYSSEEKELSANTFEWAGKIFKEDATFKLIKPIISNGEGFKLGEEGSAKGTLIKYKLGVWGNLTEISFEVQKKDKDFYYSAGGTMDFDASNLGIPVDSDKYIVKIDKLNFNEENASFESVSITGFTNSFDYGIFTLSPKKVILYNDKSKTGFEVELDAKMGNVFPSPFGDKNSLKGHAKIKTGITTDPNETKASFKLEKLHFEGNIQNPLSDLSILDWGGNRMDIGASIPVFPGISAEFGLFIESLLDFGGDILVKTDLNTDKKGITLSIDAPIAKGQVEAGAYAGVQAGSALLASFALYLEAVGKIDTKLHGTFTDVFSLSEDTPSEKASIDMTLEGDANVTAQLRAVARALLFFKKVWKYEIATRNLGHFSYSTNKAKNTGFSINTEKLVDNEPGFKDAALKEGENINGRKRTEIKEMSIKELINLSTEDRWSPNEKDEIVDSFAFQENEIVEGSKIGYETRFDNDTEDGLNKYRNNRISLAEVTNSKNSEIIEDTVSLNFLQILNARLNNLNVYSEFINNRIDPKQDITPNPDLSEQKKRKEYHTLVNEKLNITQPFVNHYSKLVTDLISEISNENTDLANGIYTVPFQNNTKEIQTIENFKKKIFRKTFILQSGISNESEMKKFSKALFSFRISKKIFQITMKNNNLLLGKKIGEKDTELRSKLANHRIDTNITLTN